MSEDSELSTAADAIQESVTQTIDVDEVESMLEGDTSARSVGQDLGRRVGRELGSVIGRELGAIVAIDIRERKGPRAILADVKRRLVELLRTLLRNADVKSGVTRLVDLGRDIVPDTMPGGMIGSAISREKVDASETEDEGEGDEETATDEAAESTVSAEELQAMREETYRELLEVMSYQDLQSIAKEVGVKANLSQEEMTEQIIEQFSSEPDQ